MVSEYSMINASNATTKSALNVKDLLTVSYASKSICLKSYPYLKEQMRLLINARVIELRLIF